MRFSTQATPKLRSPPPPLRRATTHGATSLVVLPPLHCCESKLPPVLANSTNFASFCVGLHVCWIAIT